MGQWPWKARTARGHEHGQRRAGVWNQDTMYGNVYLRSWSTTVAAGALLPLLSAWNVPWSAVGPRSMATGMERGARGMVYLLAVGVGILSWLAAVVIVTAILLGVMLLLNALAQRYWPQDVRQSLDSVHTATTTSTSASLMHIP